MLLYGTNQQTQCESEYSKSTALHKVNVKFLKI